MVALLQPAVQVAAAVPLACNVRPMAFSVHSHRRLGSRLRGLVASFVAVRGQHILSFRSCPCAVIGI